MSYDRKYEQFQNQRAFQPPKIELTFEESRGIVSLEIWRKRTFRILNYTFVGDVQPDHFQLLKTVFIHYFLRENDGKLQMQKIIR